MTKNKIYTILAVLASIIFVIFNGIYILEQTQYAIVIQFGDIIKEELKPGLKFKIPLIQNSVFFDNRIQNINFYASDASEVVSLDQKTMKLDAFAKYRIINPSIFFTTVQNDINFKNRIASVMESSIREVIGSVNFNDVLKEKRIEVMQKITTMVTSQIQKFGVEVLDVRIKRIALPEKARNAVYARMKTEREKEAMEIRAVGEEKAQLIKADADKNCAIMLAEAKKDAVIIIGKAEAEAINILSETFKQDIEFFEFYYSLEVYKKSLPNSTLVLSIDQLPFFKYLKSQN